MPKWTKEQQEAIEIAGTNVIVSAGAGSGKTAVLTSRVLHKLKQGIHINELLILTFTRAAAEEMKERIRLSIKAEPSLHDELERLDSAYITTFDSFSLSILKKYHYYFNLSKEIAITDSTIIEMKKREILDVIFTSFYEQENVLFEQMIMQFCMKDDKELKRSILEIANKIELLPNAKEYLNTYVATYYSEKYIEECIKEYVHLFKEEQQELEEELIDFSYHVDKDYYEKLNGVIRPLLDALDFTVLPTPDRLPTLPRNSEEDLKTRKDNLKKKIDALLRFKNYGSFEEIKRNIEATKPTCTIIISILIHYFEQLEVYKKENEIYDFQDISLLAIQLVRENEEVKEELKNQFKEIMIDEYQDTNNIQETFINYIANQNVYMVGDVKQSIYRFRNANPYIFKNKYEMYQENKNGIKIDLVKNFRSRKEVLENINLVFTKIMDNHLGGADYQISHQMHFGNTAYEQEGFTEQEYNMDLIEYEKKDDFSLEEIEIFAIGKDIKQKIEEKYQIFDNGTKTLHNATYSDFTILLDRSTQFDLYKKIFTYLGIPITIYKDENLNDSMDLYVLKNSIDFLLHIANNTLDATFQYDFISLARSYLYQMDDDEIFTYFLTKSFTESKLYKDFKEISDAISTKSPYEIVKAIIEKTNFYEKITTTEEIEARNIHITKLLEITRSFSVIGYDIRDFNAYLTTLIDEDYDMKYSVNNTPVDSVKLMTIHKSKGLEFPICYFSGLYKGFNIRDLKEKFMYDSKYGMILPFFKEGLQETILKELTKNKYLEEEIAEKIRLFYVALTRAKEKIIFVLPKKEEKQSRKNENGVVLDTIRKKYRSFQDILYSIKKELAPYIKELEVETLGLTKNYLFQKESILAEEELDPFYVEELNVETKEKKQNVFSTEPQELVSTTIVENMKLGIKIHEILEYIDFLNPEYDCIENAFIQKKVRFFLESPILSNKDQANIYKEYEFMYQKNDTEYHGIIDLLLEYEDHIDIIDYKLSNITEDKYITQLKGYQSYIEELTKKPVHLYLYSIFQEQIKEIQ